MKVVNSPVLLLERISNFAEPEGLIPLTLMSEIIECFGFSNSIRLWNSWIIVPSPSASMKTPSGEFITKPVSDNSFARLKMKGRNPTP
jgi:hypothetical protein